MRQSSCLELRQALQKAIEPENQQITEEAGTRLLRTTREPPKVSRNCVRCLASSEDARDSERLRASKPI